MSDERDFELAELATTAARDAAVARVRDELASEGEDDCVGCGAPIPAARKAALPSAERCIGCQTLFERRSRGS